MDYSKVKGYSPPAGTTRISELIKFKTPYELPSVSKEFFYLIRAFNDAGRIASGGQSYSPITWMELESFSNAGYDGRFSSWELRIIKKMSNIYCNGLYEYKNPSAPAPYEEEGGVVQKHREEIKRRRDARAKRLKKIQEDNPKVVILED